MLKIPKNEKYASIAFYASAAVIISALIILAIFNFGTLWGYVKAFFAVLSPFVYGFVFAYLATPILNFFEEKCFAFKNAKKDHPVLRRTLSLICTLLVIIAILTVLVYAIVPSVAGSFDTLSSQMNVYITNLQSFADKLVKNNSQRLFGEQYNTLSALLEAHDIHFSIKDILSNSFSFMKGAFDYIVDYGGRIVSEIISILIGIFAAVYFLISKEKLCAQTKKLLAAVTTRRTYLNTVRLARYTHKTFGGFIVGKVIDSLIISLICFFVFWIFKIPYHPLLALIVGLTNIIPNFGPIIGGVVGGLFLLIVQPGKVILFVILVLIIQQFDGNILGPKILGESIGLSAMWVMIAIIAAGGFFGFAGMIMGVPVTAIIYTLVKQWTERRLRKKNMPYHTAFYASDPPADDGMGSESVIIDRDIPVPELTLDDDMEDAPKKEKTSLTKKVTKKIKDKKVKKK